MPAPIRADFCLRCGTAMTTAEVAGQPRRRCPDCGFVHFPDPKVGVGAVVVHEGALLLVRRVMEPERGKWALPGGYLDAGADPRAVAAREVREEAGVEVSVGAVEDVFFDPSGGAPVFLLFRATLVGAAVVRAGDDADDAAFFPLDALPEIAFPSTRAVVDRLRR